MRLSVSVVGIALLTASAVRAQDLNEALEKAVKDAARATAPCVVQIATQGGADMVVTTAKGQSFRKALGPTTGVVVSEDGYIISSLFNFLNSPTTILVSLPGRDEPLPAKRIANDKSRMLTLLQVDAKGLPTPKASPKSEIVEGQLAIALGRTLDAKKNSPPSVSVGIISAVGRIWGKAIQTDAKISPVNYGGPLVDVRGRVQGILIPASPKGDDVTAGFEWYDSGIGFAIPFEDVLAVLPRLKAGKDIEKGILGVRFKSADIYGVQPEISQVNKDSPAEKSGLQPGDQIVELDGHPVTRLAQLQHAIGVKYAGDKVSLKYKRGADVVEIKDLALVGSLQETAHPFLGILPLRDDPRLGVEIRHVFAKSPAEKAGLKPGERILKIGVGKAMRTLSGAKAGRDELFDVLNGLSPATEVILEVADKDGKTREATLSLESLPGSVAGLDWAIPEKFDRPASFGKAGAPLEKLKGKADEKPAPEPRKAETGLLERATGDGETKYWIFAPKTYDGTASHGIVLWLHPPGRNREADIKELVEAWEAVCADRQLILVAPKSDNESGWIASEADGAFAAVRDTMKAYAVDSRRVVAHGMGVGGQMALYLGVNHRDLFRGVAAVGAVPGAIKDNQPNQRLAFYLAAGELDPLVRSVADSRVKLAEKRYSAVFRELPKRGREYLTDSALLELSRWIDSLDKQ